jgi:hypothetical protein
MVVPNPNGGIPHTGSSFIIFIMLSCTGHNDKITVTYFKNGQIKKMQGRHQLSCGQTVNSYVPYNSA